MRSFFVLLGLAGCASPLAVEGAPCPCPGGYTCDLATDRCVAGAAAPAPDAGPPAPMPEATVCVHPGRTLIRPLGPVEYANTVADLLGVTADTGLLPPDSEGLPETVGPGLSLPDLARVYGDLAGQVATKVTVDARLLSCNPDPPGQNTCARKFVAAFGLRAFRRPLTQAEIDELVAAFDAGRGTTPDAGYRLLVRQMLSSDRFYLRQEVGEATGPVPGLRSLTQFEIATRLAYFLTGSTPDDPLLAAAAMGGLHTKAQVEAQARRLLTSPRVGAMVRDFYRRWLHLDAVRDAEKDGDTPAFTSELRQALVTSGRETAVLGMWAFEGDQSTLFREPMYGNRSMADFYGLSAPAGDGFEVLQPLGGQQRFGILTLPAVLSTLADGAQSHPVRRGGFILRELLCKSIPPPSGGIMSPPELRPEVTGRARFAQHSMNPSCWACHANFDPIGFALENYDGYGRWRTTQNGQPIDASSGEVGQLLGHPFQGPQGLADLLAGSSDFARCTGQQWFRYALGRPVDTDDECTLDELEKAYVEGGRKLRPLLVAIVRSDAFLTRTP